LKRLPEVIYWDVSIWAFFAVQMKVKTCFNWSLEHVLIFKS